MTKRNRRAGVEDRWTKTIRDEHGNAKKVPSGRNGKGKRWQARYVDDEMNETSKSFDRKVDAQKWLDNEVTAKLASGTYVTPKAGQTTVGVVYEQWSAVQAHLAPKTVALRSSEWRVHVEPKWGQTPVVDVKITAVRAWVTEMVAAEVGVPTIQKAFGVLSMVLGAAVEDRRIPHNPCDGVKLPRSEHHDRGYLSHEQVAALAAEVDHLPEVIRFLAYTGLRWGEMAALRVQDFDMLRRRVNISQAVTESGTLIWGLTKTHERRSVPFPASLSEELAALMVGKGRGDLVFLGKRGAVLRGGNYRNRYFSKAVAKCQETDETFPTITPHDLRHTAASLAVSVGANVKALQRMLGHKKASMTLDVYADLFDDDLDAVAVGLDAALTSRSAGPQSKATNA
jgi:integrase